MPTLDAVLFDFGGVFTDSPFHVLRRFGAELGADPERLLEIVFGSYHEDSDHPWHRVERGELALTTARETIIELGAREGIDSDPFKVFARLASADSVARPEFVERVRRCRERGLATALVTNNAAEFRAGWRRMLPADELFDAIVDSSEVGLRKPDPAIFELTLERLGGLSPARTAFVDDFEGNVAAARALGMHGILVEEDPASALAALDALLSP